ncbi:neuraminidase [Edaphobacter acidisoli]|uniref:exo-alpha-sialidase n=1 Tax=Edaphobacter acidisoli TaxID=2040573 RepID=A0A916RS62_9BACT|nr:sialidase family protein [Edaphobacter acidisoli]GGA65075.1 neuraminidase [Edaphobacter acidisoli]
MISRIRFAIVCALSLVLLAYPSVAASSPQWSQTLLWKAGTDGYETFRIPGVVATARGTILAYAVGRRFLKDGDWSDSDIFFRRSDDDGSTWSRAYRVAGNSHGVTDNPVAIADRRRGVIHLLYQHNYAQVFYMRSDDDGKSFTRPTDITSALVGIRAKFDWTVVALGPGHAIQLRNGRLLVPVWMAEGGSIGNGRRRHSPTAITTLYSDNDGRTWHHGEIIAVNSPDLPNPNEMQVVQLADGNIMANIRSGGKQMLRAVAISPDGISHWTAPHFDKHLYDPICAAAIVRYGKDPTSGRNLMLFTNPDSQSLVGRSSRSHGLRRNLVLKMSENGGGTWPASRLLHEGSAGYSDIAVAPDKMIYVIYEGAFKSGDKANSVTILRFNLAWAQSQDDSEQH